MQYIYSSVSPSREEPVLEPRYNLTPARIYDLLYGSSTD